MRFISTRAQTEPRPLRETVMSGLAPDGGLFLPETIPDAKPMLGEWRDLPFTELFERVVGLFMEGEIPADALRTIVRRSFSVFDHADVTPVVRVGDLYMVELFHGPTLAFKDVALQFLGNLFEHYLAGGNERLTLVGATSGDTGSAAIHAVRGRKGVEAFILFPKDRVSPIQELQMTTVADGNVHAVAVEGSFDDAQAIVKGCFNDRPFNAAHGLGAVNSINWVRVMAQIVYYFHGYLRVVAQGGCALGEPVRIAVPTGNFGNIFAGYLARRMGLPVERLILATNANDILHRFVSEGVYRRGPVVETLSPSMDIQVASNFERYLFELSGRDGGQVTRWLGALAETGEFSIAPELLSRVREDFASSRCDDAETLRVIAETHRATGYLLDPHSAVGVHGAREHGGGGGVPVICLAAAHPAKFGEAITAAIGRPPDLPEALAGLSGLPTRRVVLPVTLEAVQGYIAETLRAVPLPLPGGRT